MENVTIGDVARAAGVSPATVSRVLNGHHGVADELRQRVVTAVAELGYRPNSQARSLRTRATSVLGLIISDITNPFFPEIARGVEDAAHAAGFSVVLANTDEDLAKEQRYLEVAAAERMAGVVLAPASSAETDISVLTGRGIPVVAVDRRLPGHRVDSVTVDNLTAARDATRHLVSIGRTRIGFVGGPLATTTASDRLAGYREGLGDLPELIAYGDYRIDGGRVAARKLLEREERPDALFVSNNLMTIGAITALADAGLKHPDDVALAGFDDQTWQTGLLPPLTLVTQPTYELGKRAATVLLERIRTPDAPPADVILPATLAVHRS
ncbi:LacI family DNA-binding transcriptional regulator [Cryptosporangium sp. NPDC051539]|uniref:LacI family DNA-binding transcriptional regulator n=1 Tax=Cryptosporangium sp. NPDC051539 TaxID=3363962 RepID=UPI003797A250